MTTLKPKLLLKFLCLSIMSAALIGTSLMANAASRGTQVVIFTANWCASCREIIPMVQEVASQNGLSVQEVDVDGQNAPDQAKNYGISIPTRQLPQVYLVKNGSVSLLFDGRQYRSGQADTVRSTILQNLQQGR